MKKILFPSIFIVLSLILVMVLRAHLPKNSKMLIFFFVFLLLDGYLWLSVSKTIKKLNPALRVSATLLYWFPLILLLCLVGYGFYIPFLDWNLPMRTYVQSFMLVFFATKFFPILTLIISDVMRLVKFIFCLIFPGRKSLRKPIHRFDPLLIAGWVIGGVIFMTLTAGTLFWQFDFRVRHEVITLHELPSSFDGYKIVQFSDVHLGSWGSKQRLQEAMNEINQLHPDVIFFTGDMFNYCTADGRGFEQILRSLHAPDGIYAVMGNHDYGDYINWPSRAAKKQNLVDVKYYYQNLGWKLLLNDHDIIKHGNDSIAIIGVDNWGASARFQRLGDIGKADEGIESMTIQLLLSHDPSYWEKVISQKYPQIDVTFAGHTHGGQIGIDCCNIHWSPVKWISALWSGLYTVTDAISTRYLYVNQGLGNIGYSGRIGILPEITLITLKRK